MAMTDEEMFEAVSGSRRTPSATRRNAQEDEAVFLAFLRKAEWSATTNRFGSEYTNLSLTLSARVTRRELTAIERLLRD